MKNLLATALTLALSSAALAQSSPNIGGAMLPNANTSGATNASNITSGTLSSSRLAFNTAVLSNAQPANPAATASTTSVMMGVGTTCTITPLFSTRVSFTIFGDVANNTTADTVGIKLFYSTGTAPANGVSTAGFTQSGNSIVMTSTSGNAQVPFSMTGIAVGLTVGQAIWFDLALNVNAGSGSVSNLTCIANEL